VLSPSVTFGLGLSGGGRQGIAPGLTGGNAERGTHGPNAADVLGHSCQPLVDVAPSPRLAWFERPDDRVAGSTGVRASVPVRRGVAAPDMPAGKAQSQVEPGRADAQAVLAPLSSVRHDGADVCQMRIGWQGHSDNSGEVGGGPESGRAPR
jgi:hypothetical protein